MILEYKLAIVCVICVALIARFATKWPRQNRRLPKRKPIWLPSPPARECLRGIPMNDPPTRSIP